MRELGVRVLGEERERDAADYVCVCVPASAFVHVCVSMPEFTCESKARWKKGEWKDKSNGSDCANTLADTSTGTCDESKFTSVPFPLAAAAAH